MILSIPINEVKQAGGIKRMKRSDTKELSNASHGDIFPRPEPDSEDEGELLWTYCTAFDATDFHYMCTTLHSVPGPQVI